MPVRMPATARPGSMFGPNDCVTTIASVEPRLTRMCVRSPAGAPVRLTFEADESSQRDGDQQSRRGTQGRRQHCTSPPWAVFFTVGRICRG